MAASSVLALGELDLRRYLITYSSRMRFLPLADDKGARNEKAASKAWVPVASDRHCDCLEWPMEGPTIEDCGATLPAALLCDLTARSGTTADASGAR